MRAIALPFTRPMDVDVVYTPTGGMALNSASTPAVPFTTQTQPMLSP